MSKANKNKSKPLSPAAAQMTGSINQALKGADGIDDAKEALCSLIVVDDAIEQVHE